MLDAGVTPANPLSFTDSRPYPVRITESQNKTGLKEVVLTGRRYRLTRLDVRLRFAGDRRERIISSDGVFRYRLGLVDERLEGVELRAGGVDGAGHGDSVHWRGRLG